MNKLNMVGKKICSKCKDGLPATTEYFPRNRSSKDGLSHWCKVCHRDHRKTKKEIATGPLKVVEEDPYLEEYDEV